MSLILEIIESFMMIFIGIPLMIVFASIAFMFYLYNFVVRKILGYQYRNFIYFFHPLGGDTYETWNPFKNNSWEIR